MEATPTVLLAMWAAGLAAGGSLVASWKVVGRGYVWLTAAVVGLVGVALALVVGNVIVWVGVALAVMPLFVARRHKWVIGLFAASAALFIATGMIDGDIAPLVTGAVLLGGVSTEMMLGHWFLIDPTLPRWSLNRLAILGGVGLLADVVLVIAVGLAGDSESVLVWAYVALVTMTALLTVGVYLSLREPSYTGVMAATGLSYLAVLTAFGVAVLGRMLAT